MPKSLVILSPVLIVALATAGCHDRSSASSDPYGQAARVARADAACRAAWGKGLDQLPEVGLVVITAQNGSIQDEFQRAFSLWHAQRFGQRVRVVWRNVGGGGSSIEDYLFNVYTAGGNPDIDILWGGGELTFMKLAKGAPATGPLLEKLQFSGDLPAAVPPRCGGTPLRDPDGRWIGSAVSGFGFLCNVGMLRRCGIAPPQSWDDLAGERLAGLLELADPMQSASAASAYRMIAMSGDDWPDGWAKLLGVLSNARSFTDSAGSAANAPVLGEALVATCIDFYGATRVAEAPDQLQYVSPSLRTAQGAIGQTTFSPDPIGILKDPPHRPLAQRFVDFVLSRQGQALWALPAGQPDGPTRSALGRQPIRPDVYDLYAGKMLPYIVNPYASGQSLVLTPQKARLSFTVLRELVYAAAVVNCREMKLARRALIEVSASRDRKGAVGPLLAEFNSLPANVAGAAQMDDLARQLKDKKQYDLITRGWRDFFAGKYKRIVDEARPPHP